LPPRAVAGPFREPGWATQGQFRPDAVLTWSERRSAGPVGLSALVRTATRCYCVGREGADRSPVRRGRLAVSLNIAQLYSELSASRARIVAADQERRRIERDLHDGAQQRLVSLALHLDATRAAAPPELDAQLRHALDEANGAAEELREIARGIHPAILVEGGLGPALRTLARRSPIPVDVDVRAHGRLPEQVEVSRYYVVAEALTNAAKHARASSVAVAVEADPARAVLRVTVRDDGTGRRARPRHRSASRTASRRSAAGFSWTAREGPAPDWRPNYRSPRWAAPSPPASTDRATGPAIILPGR
jgi:signal transduction histidine kinase